MRSDDAPAPYARLLRFQFLASATLWIGAIAAFGGIAYAINGATQAGAYVTVPVTLLADLEPHISLAKTRLPEGVLLQPAGGAIELRAWDATILEELLSRADVAVTGLALGLGAVLLRRLILSILQGEPFRAGNPARIAGLAGLIAVTGVLTSLLPYIAATKVLARLDLSPPFMAPLAIPLVPLSTALLLLVLAVAFRRGAELAHDVAATI